MKKKAQTIPKALVTYSMPFMYAWKWSISLTVPLIAIYMPLSSYAYFQANFQIKWMNRTSTTTWPI